MAPKTVPLINFQTKELKPEQVCKLDWHFGIGNHPNDWNFDWLINTGRIILFNFLIFPKLKELSIGFPFRIIRKM
jgi:hypothetical protein